MAYVVKWTSKAGVHTELAFARKEDAIVSASTALDRGDKDVEVLSDERLGLDEPLEHIVPRLRCGRCGADHPELSIGHDPRPVSPQRR
jgi:hypothetical protein